MEYIALTKSDSPRTRRAKSNESHKFVTNTTHLTEVCHHQKKQ